MANEEGELYEVSANVAAIISSLKVKRGRIKASFTRTEQFVSNIPGNVLVEELITRNQKIEEFFELFSKLDDQLTLHDVASEYSEVEERYFSLKGKLTNIINQKQHELRAETPRSGIDQHNTNMDQLNSTMALLFDQQRNILGSFTQQSPNRSNPLNSTITNQNDVRLPKINLPVFSSDFKEWPAFKDLFLTSIHNKLNLSNSYKFQYLKGSLTGEAATLIKHITISENNYEEAWNRIVQRYDKKKQILTSYINTFVNQPALTQLSAITLRKLTDTSDELIRGISSLGTEANSTDPWLIYILLTKCDSDTRQAWATESHAQDVPKFDEFLLFLNKRCDALESIDSTQKKTIQKSTRSLYSANKQSCPKCNEAHHLFYCTKFKELDIGAKRAFVAKNKMCFNCLGLGHLVNKCKSGKKCYICKKMHHSLLHITEDISKNVSDSIQSTTHRDESNPNQQEDPIRTNITSLNVRSTNRLRVTVLPTAIVQIPDSFGIMRNCRILFDSGSESTFISERCVQELRCKRKPARIPVSGLGEATSGLTRGIVKIVLHSRFHSNQQMEVRAYILPKLTANIPATNFDLRDWANLKGIELADPDFNVPNVIDIILGADFCFQTFISGPSTISDTLVLQNTRFGFIVTGTVENVHKAPVIKSFHASISGIEIALRRFWELEEVQGQNETYTVEEQKAEEIFATTTEVDNTGRYKVRLPFKTDTPTIGETMQQAHNRLLAMERRFKGNPELRQQYCAFMNEYEQLGHKEPIPTFMLSDKVSHAYLPHHAVLKPSSTTTRLRVVFDGSATTSIGNTLNQVLCVGPKTQRDLYYILLAFRTYQIAISADIEKMFRQVLVAEKDRHFQRILWRNSPENPIEHYWLNTVTYGTAPAPFLATRVLKQIALDADGKFPLAESALLNSFYMDDYLGGADDVSTACEIYQQLATLLKGAGFHLRKWISNSKQFVKTIAESESEDIHHIVDHTDMIKVLGLIWIPEEDAFSFNIELPEDVFLTKRQILSEASRIFDPLGLIAPITILVKILLQELWIKGFQWDEQIQGETSRMWIRISHDLQQIKEIRIPRWVQTTNQSYEIHGFADASQAAYAAVIYCRSTNDDGNCSVRLLTAKTRVKPIKQVSIPRLELCAALLLARLLVVVKEAIQQPNIRIEAWSDSSVVLSWLSVHPSKWKTFIGNRTSEILNILPRAHWHHVYTKDNPADLATRGMTVKTLMNCNLWWKGPDFLSSQWKDYLHGDESNKEEKAIIKKESKIHQLQVHTANTEQSTLDYLFNKFSSLTKILRILARCYRFANQCKSKTSLPSWITVKEIERVRRICICWCQQSTFSKEIITLQKNNNLSKSSALKSLMPFLDKYEILRVGERLENATCSFKMKHPIILPKEHIFSKRLIEYLLRIHLHAGITLLTNIIRQEYWIISIRVAVKRIINKCNSCIRQRAAVSKQLMGNLPLARLSCTRAFENVGIDYAGPITLLRYRGRGARCTKGYICVFTCLNVRAVHLEAASDLSTEAFLACLKRFISRRGHPMHIYSDNGTNFVGACNQMKEIYKMLKSTSRNALIADYLSKSKVNWHFSPPSAPHFGGCWESSVKLVKGALKKTIGDSKLTFEELSTLLTQIEALINSRPLTPLTSDISSLDTLTPAHFLIGQPMISLPAKSIEASTRTLPSMWRHLTRMQQDFWKRWSLEYLATLQQRPKWTQVTENFEVGDLVIIREENLPPSVWALGRVITLHPGGDELVRVVTLRTMKGDLKRPIAKLVKLSIAE